MMVALANEAILVKRREFIAIVGGAVGWPFSAGAQQALPVIGYFDSSPESDSESVRSAFRQGLDETGYVDGRNTVIEYRLAHGQYDRLPALAGDLVRRQVSVIAAIGGTPTALAAKAATSTIPIVFYVGVDPVELGLVASLNRPGGNMTGVAILSIDLAAKRLELMRELLPAAAVVALLVNPGNPITEPQIRNVRDAARALGLQLHVLQASTVSDIDAAFATIVKLRPGALMVGGDPFLTSRTDQLVALAARFVLPTIYVWREFVVAGGLMSYAPNRTSGIRQVGVYVGKILNGAKPADLPVQQVARVELVINLKTAKALGLTVPPSLLARADEVIE
jgi:putative tryptophan/tyrosine transport system substrate-binding protein